jgi:hypothetical protein
VPPDEEEEERNGQPEKVAGDEDRSDQREGQEQEGQRDGPRPPPRGMSRTPALFRLSREVDDQCVEVGIGLRCEAAVEPLLELDRVESSVHVLAPEDLGHRFPLPVADAQTPVARAALSVIALLWVFWHGCPFLSL